MNELYKNSHKMPWTINTVPHALLDILRGCNCKCEACYNTETLKLKSLDEVINDFNDLKKVRNVSTIGLVGGEPLMHPELFEIIKYLKSQNLSLEILTNGVLLDDAMADKLALAGVDLVFLHIDSTQKRPDLSFPAIKDETDALRTKKAKMLHERGIEVAMSITISKKELSTNLEGYMSYFKNSPYVKFFLLTLYKDLAGYRDMKGCLVEGIKGNPVQSCPDNPDMDEITKILYEKEHIKPYWYMPGRYDKTHPRWVSYLCASSYDKKGKLKCFQHLKYSKLEENYIENYRKKHGKYPFFKKQTPLVNFCFILFNGLFGGYFTKNLLFLLKSIGLKKELKRIFVQEPAYINENGELEHCESCPDATVKNGKVIPACVCDCIK